VAQVVEHLPGKHEALGSVPAAARLFSFLPTSVFVDCFIAISNRCYFV
jgi:hypothetical protein